MRLLDHSSSSLVFPPDWANYRTLAPPLYVELDDDGVPVGDRAHGVAPSHKGAAGKILVEILPPNNFAGLLVEGVHPGEDSDGVDIVAEDERRSVRSGSVFHGHPRLEGSV